MLGLDCNVEFNEYTFDIDVNNCLTYMYLFLMNNDPNLTLELESKFEEAYFKLEDKKKEYIKQDFLEILKEKEKGKQKRRDIYE